MIRTHKNTGWTREPIGYGDWKITPTDESGSRIVALLSAGTWQNHANDCREHVNTDRMVLVSGDPLPAWAVEWLTKAAQKSAESGRRALRAAIDEADWHRDSREGW